jgi:hypothetical protein
LLLLCGCSSILEPNISYWKPAVAIPRKTSGSTKFWEPSDLDRRHAEDLARWYAINRLSVKVSQIRKMKTDCLPFYKKENPILVIGFFDPEYFTPIEGGGGHYSWPLGGFPAFFSVDVDPIKWRVIGHYASPE